MKGSEPLQSYQIVATSHIGGYHVGFGAIYTGDDSFSN